MATPAASSVGPPSREELSKRTVPELKALCEDLGLPRGGNKAILVSKLLEAGGPKMDGIIRANLMPAVPVSAGPWMRKCVETWKLLPPYNTAVGSTLCFPCQTCAVHSWEKIASQE